MANARESTSIENCDTQLEKIEEEMMVRHKNDEARDIAIKQAKRNVMRAYEILVQQELERIKKEHVKEFAQFTKELVDIEHKRAHQFQLLAPALAQAKKGFADITFPFMEQAAGSKDFYGSSH